MPEAKQKVLVSSANVSFLQQLFLVGRLHEMSRILVQAMLFVVHLDILKPSQSCYQIWW